MQGGGGSITCGVKVRWSGGGGIYCGGGKGDGTAIPWGGIWYWGGREKGEEDGGLTGFDLGQWFDPGFNNFGFWVGWYSLGLEKGVGWVVFIGFGFGG